jgi:alanyl-tRNA synthetase
MGLPANRLYATVFEGSSDDNLHRDNEAAGYWENHLPKKRILNGSKKDNFWEMGDTGPCGPCSEIHIDLRPETERAKKSGKDLVNRIIHWLLKSGTWFLSSLTGKQMAVCRNCRPNM